jgi:hypothetical protein
VGALLFLGACETEFEEDTAVFERAEDLYAVGDYDSASALYRSFLVDHADSPLRAMAELRIRLIERELDSVMGRRGSPAPLRVNPLGYQTTQETEPVTPRFESPSLRVLGE